MYENVPPKGALQKRFTTCMYEYTIRDIEQTVIYKLYKYNTISKMALRYTSTQYQIIPCI